MNTITHLSQSAKLHFDKPSLDTSPLDTSPLDKPKAIAKLDKISEASASASAEKNKASKALLKHPNLWRAGQLASARGTMPQGIDTGFSQLNEHLPGAGWPTGGLMEFILSCAGIGELRLLIPTLKRL